MSTATSIVEEFAALVAQELPAHRREHPDESWASRVAWQRRLHAHGWAAPGWPVEHGGRGLGAAERVAVEAVLARAGAPMVAGVLGINNVAPALMAFGTPEQVAHLPAILDAAEIWCQGFSEPEAGSDLASLRTRARRDGDAYVIDGQKVWTSQGVEATHCQLLVRTDPDAPAHRGISALLVPMDTPGVTARPLRQANGATEFAEVFFDGVRVPASALLGAENDGWRVTMTTLAHERSGQVALAQAVEADLRRALGLLNRPLDPIERDLVGRRLAEARVAGLLGERALLAERPGPAQSVVKLAWSLARRRMTETVQDLSGPAGLLANHASSEYLYGRAATIAAGTTEIVKDLLADRVLGLPRR
ncbi:acyl-CoA dehydrogenase family protein [Sporichthya polymorpha]|uniref:acyl-CoA dehydrogenase family protein n=1 Tax=Sporichthya polymorpha TaxID=35751 RepID=UPI0004908F27|nr:acyl-CoA dehydrogenase family protein [Sporichthya polymorpha]